MSKLIRENCSNFQVVRSYTLEDLPSGQLATFCDEKGCMMIPSGPARPKNRSQQETAKALEDSEKQSRAEIDREAYEKGFEQGHRDGLELAAKEMSTKIERLENLLKELLSYKLRICKETEAQLLELTLALAEVIIRHEVQCRPDVVRETLRAALELVAKSTSLRICLHPEDLENVQQFLPELDQRLGSTGRLELEGDPAAPRGGCLVETDCGIIDAHLEEQLENLKEQLRQKLQLRQQNAASFRENAT